MNYLIISLLVVNTILLIAIAGSVAKVIKYLSGEPDELPAVQVEQRLLGLPDRQPNYAEVEVPTNYDGMTVLPPNSDGVGGSIE